MRGAVPPPDGQRPPTRLAAATVPLQAGTSASDARLVFITNLQPTLDDRIRGVFLQRQIGDVAAMLRTPPRIVHVGGRGAGGLLASRRAVRAAIRELRPDVLHIVYGLSGAAVPFGLDVPAVLTLCGSDLLWGPTTGHPRGLLEYVVSVITACRAQRITVESAVLRDALPSASLRARTIILPPGVDRATFRPLPRSECRARLGWPVDEGVVLFPANPSRTLKRYGLALAAVSELDTGRGDRIVLRAMTRVPPGEVPLYLNAADCVIITSAWEGGPLAFYEALACGTPVVSVPVGYARDQTWRTPYVRVTVPTPVALRAELIDVFRNPVPHECPADVIIPDPVEYASRLLAVYLQVLDGA